MFPNRFHHDRKVTSVLSPLCTRLLKEILCITDYLQTVDGSKASDHEHNETNKFANLYHRKILVELESPTVFFRMGSPLLKQFDPKREKAINIAQDISENLHSLFSRLDINDLYVYEAGSTNSRFYKSLSYYRMALLVAIKTLDVGHENSNSPFASRTIRSRLRKLRKRTDQLVAIPTIVVDQFNEESYLLANQDVQTSLASGNIASGLEHFAMQGAREAKEGGRPVPGVDINLIRFGKNTFSSEQLKTFMLVLESSGIFDKDWYQNQYGKTSDPLLDYCQKGYLDGKAPNRLFDQAWYCETYSDINLEEVIPAYHYTQVGEAEGRMPCERFDPSWYQTHYELNESDGLALVHYLKFGWARNLNPNKLFDVDFYNAKYPDVLKAGMDPVDHYYDSGWREERFTSTSFNAVEYKSTVLKNSPNVNPLTHSLLAQSKNRNFDETAGTVPSKVVDLIADKHLPSLGDIAGNIHYFANPGPDFEGPSTVDCTQLKAKAKTVAFYLPQFHAFEENDRWWGTGFTEWRNVARGTPRYAGHYQPRIPRDFGFYDLNDESMLYKQSELALQNGIEAFCFYYHWFNGKRLIHKPLDMFAAATDIDQEFCIMFANENWTRTWDGCDNEVLMEQNYRDEDEDAFIEDAAVYFRNERYMQVNGRPLYIIYRPGLLPDAKEMLARWRAKWKAAIGVEPWMLMVQGFGDEDPDVFGLDGAVEFPPHKLCKDIPDMQGRLHILDPNYKGNTKAYTDVIERSLGEKPPSFPLVKTVVPHWDNDARREGRGFTMHGSTPALYESWLQGAIQYAQENPFKDEPLVFINAWNEWAEGAYLEPDVHFGHAYLNATRRAVHGLTNSRDRQKLLLVGHDAHPHGAQMLLMNMAKIYAEQFGLDVTILLKDGGPLVAAYREVCSTVILGKLGEQNLEGWARKQGFDIAICNTTVTGDLIPTLARAGIEVTTLCHELPNLIKEYELQENLQIVADHSKYLVFPSTIVEDGFNSFTRDVRTTQKILPQGVYSPIEFDQDKRSEVRQNLGISDDAKLVLNVGFADLRKGFDIFLHVARQLIAENSNVHFVWAGAISQDMQRWVQSDLDETLCKNIHLVGFTDEMADYYSSSDCLFLTSREDPYPSVVLEAMCIGSPIVLFENATGFDSLINLYGKVVSRNDMASVKRSITKCLYEDTQREKDARIEYVNKHCRFDEYCFELLKMLKPELKKVSVVVPNYNYEVYLPSRLNSVFNQSYPIFETLVLDDCSVDNSLSVISNVAIDANRKIEIIANENNSGNVFHQWNKGMEACRGDILWIAEADDLADPTFVARSLEAFTETTAFSFTNSKQVSSNDELLAKNYNYYYDLVDHALFQGDFKLEGTEFIKRAMGVRNVIMNVSSVLWQREVLEEAFEDIGNDLFEYNLVGDWRIYLEVLAKEGRSIAFISDSLNVHRRHDESVTRSLDYDEHIAEISSIHDLLKTLIETDSEDMVNMENYIEELRRQFNSQLAA